MARNQAIDDDEDADSPERTEAEARETVDKVLDGAGNDDVPMTVSEDGTVTFGDSDARGEKTAKAGDEDEEEHDDPSLTDSQREALRAKRREEKKRRREAARKREDDLRGQNAALQQTVQDLVGRLNQVEQRTSSIDVARLDEEMRGAAFAVQSWEAEFADAINKSDGPRAKAAMDKINEAKAEGTRLFQTKQAITRSAAVSVQSVPPEVLRRVDEWRKGKEWYNPAKPNRDTRIALIIDAEVAEDGYHPGTDEFWEELDNRLREALPGRYTDDNDGNSSDSGGRGGRASGSGDSRGDNRGGSSTRRTPASGGGSGSSSGGASFKLSAERVTALKDAGMWNDPKKREAAIRNFIEYDKKAKGR